MLGSHPVGVEVAPEGRVSRWRPLVNWLLALPLLLWLSLLSVGAAAVVLVAWFAIVFTRRMPGRLGDYLMGVLRFGWRVAAFLFGLTARYPGFRVVAGYVDPADQPAVVYSAQALSRNRVTVLFRLVLILPAFLFVFPAAIVLAALLFAAWWIVLVLGRWPDGLRRNVAGYFRYLLRFAGYAWLVVDEFPPVIPDLEPVTVEDAPVFVRVRPDPREVSGPPWLRLVGGENYQPPRLLRWPILVAVVVGGIGVGLLAFDHPGKPTQSVLGNLPPLAQAAVSSHPTTSWKTVRADWVPGPYNYYAFSQVSCASSTNCMTVGGGSLDAQFTTSSSFIERWDGERWVLISGSVRAGIQLGGVKCLSANDCWADGARATEPGATMLSGPSVGVFEHWNGLTWTQSSFAPPGSFPGIDCLSPTDCLAVGSGENARGDDHASIVRWNGSRWSTVMAPTPAGQFGAGLRSVSCPSTAWCDSVGEENSASEAPPQLFGEHFNGQSWSLFGLPQVPGRPWNHVSSLQCPTTTFCLLAGGVAASGDNATGDTGPLSPFVERWNGQSWSLVTLPNAVRANGGYISGMSCPSASKCWIVGFSSSDSPILVLWNGSSFVQGHLRASAAYLDGVGCTRPAALRSAYRPPRRRAPIPSLVPRSRFRNG
jgi:hypothetical protein